MHEDIATIKSCLGEEEGAQMPGSEPRISRRKQGLAPGEEMGEDLLNDALLNYAAKERWDQQNLLYNQRQAVARGIQDFGLTVNACHTCPSCVPWFNKVAMPIKFCINSKAMFHTRSRWP